MSIWIFNQRDDSEYDDVEGRQYSYPRYLPNAQQVSPGDLFVYYRPKNASDIGGFFFGAGRVGALDREGGMVTAHVEDYVELSRPVNETELTNKPRSNQQNSINRLAAELFFDILRLGGVSPHHNRMSAEPDTPRI